MGDQVVISKIELLYGRLFQIDIHNESKDEWYRVFADKDELYIIEKNAHINSHYNTILKWYTEDSSA